MNHINDPDWRENLPDMRLAMNQQDINLKQTFRKEDFAKKPSSANLVGIPNGSPSDVQLVQDEDALSEVLDLEMDEQNGSGLTIEQREKETESIKRAGDQIAKANIVRRENEFVQQSVEEVLSNIEQVKKQNELDRRIAKAQEEARQKAKQEAEKKAKEHKPADEANVGLSDADKYFFDGFTSFN